MSCIQQFVRVGVSMESALLRKIALAIWDGKDPRATQVSQPIHQFQLKFSDPLLKVYLLAIRFLALISHVFVIHIQSQITSCLCEHFPSSCTYAAICLSGCVNPELKAHYSSELQLRSFLYWRLMWRTVCNV